MKLLGPTLHGAFDYGLALAFVWMPGILGFTYTAANLSQSIGVAYLVLSILTRYPLGLVAAIPFAWHGVLEALMAGSWIALPWVFGFAGTDAAARSFFVLAGAGLLLVALLTDYRPVPLQPIRAERRRAPVDRRQYARAVATERRLRATDRRRYADG